MTTPLSGPTPPACTADPERWFDRRRRTSALEACLRCPVRTGCAREALRAQANWGMWAGVWIDGELAEVADYLEAIATTRPTPRHTIPKARPTCHVAPDPRPLPHRPPIRRCSAIVAAVARADGNCEVMADGCKLIADRQLNRVPGRTAREASSASEVYCVCGACAEAIGSSTALVRSCGYLVASARLTRRVPFRWRGARWVLLGSAGELLETAVKSADCA
jgi:Transcription factor WhiB